MRQIRCIVVQPGDLVYSPLAKGVIEQHWAMVRDWIELGIGVRLNWAFPPSWLVAPWAYSEIANEWVSPTGDVAGLVLDWMNSPAVAPELRPGGPLADQSGDAWLIMAIGGGGWAGSWRKNSAPSNVLVNLALVGSAVTGPILGASGMPNLNDCHNFYPPGAWQCEYGTAFGTIIHEMSHAAFDLDHDGLPGDLPSVMSAHWLVNPSNFAEAQYIPRHAAQARASTYVMGAEPTGRLPVAVFFAGALLLGMVALAPQAMTQRRTKRLSR